MRDLLNHVAQTTARPSTHYEVSLAHGGSPRSVIVTGTEKTAFARAAHRRFGSSIAVLDAAALETQQIDQATGFGVPIVGIYRAPVQGRDTSQSGSVLLEELKRLNLDDDADRNTDATILLDGDPETLDSVGEDNDAPDLVYVSTEAFLDDLARTVVVAVRTAGNETHYESEAGLLARFTAGLEDETSVTPTITDHGIVLEPCRHDHTDADTECPLCEAQREANPSVAAPIMTAEGEIIEPATDDVEVLPNQRPAMVYPEDVGEPQYVDDEPPTQTIIVPKDAILFDEPE